MPTHHNVRAIDRKDFSEGRYRDFVTRKRGLTKKQVYSLCFATIVVLVAVTFLVYNDMMMGSILCILVGTLLLLTARQDETHKRQMQATEFLNALFASALGAGHKFCMIVKKDGEIVYLDRSFQQMFPDMLPKSKRMLDELIAMYNVPEPQRAPVMQSIAKDNETLIHLQIEGGRDHTLHAIALQVEPILRPSGFYLLRGRIA